MCPTARRSSSTASSPRFTAHGRPANDATQNPARTRVSMTFAWPSARVAQATTPDSLPSWLRRNGLCGGEPLVRLLLSPLMTIASRSRKHLSRWHHESANDSEHHQEDGRYCNEKRAVGNEEAVDLPFFPLPPDWAVDNALTSPIATYCNHLPSNYLTGGDEAP